MAAINIKINIGTGQSVAGEALTIANQALAVATGIPTMSVANNLTTTVAGYVLDARQGNELYKLILESDRKVVFGYIGDGGIVDEFVKSNGHLFFTEVISIYDKMRSEVVIYGHFSANNNILAEFLLFASINGIDHMRDSVIGNIYNVNNNFESGLIIYKEIIRPGYRPELVIISNIDINALDNHFFEIKFTYNP